MQFFRWYTFRQSVVTSLLYGSEGSLCSGTFRVCSSSVLIDYVSCRHVIDKHV